MNETGFIKAEEGTFVTVPAETLNGLNEENIDLRTSLATVEARLKEAERLLREWGSFSSDVGKLSVKTKTFLSSIPVSESIQDNSEQTKSLKITTPDTEPKCFCGVGYAPQPHCPIHGTPKPIV